jgi:hypothetical protein
MSTRSKALFVIFFFSDNILSVFQLKVFNDVMMKAGDVGSDQSRRIRRSADSTAIFEPVC